MRLRLERAAALTESKRLAAVGVDVEVVTEERKNENGQKVRHWICKGQRKDVFRLLLERRALDESGFDAIRRYEEALDTAAGHNTPERRPDHIRASVEGAPGQNISQAMILASHRVRWIEDRLPSRDRKLLSGLRMNPPGQWHAVVASVTGETNDDTHAPLIRAMADNVRDALATFDRLSKRAA